MYTALIKGQNYVGVKITRSNMGSWRSDPMDQSLHLIETYSAAVIMSNDFKSWCTKLFSQLKNNTKMLIPNYFKKRWLQFPCEPLNFVGTEACPISYSDRTRREQI